MFRLQKTYINCIFMDLKSHWLQNESVTWSLRRDMKEERVGLASA